MAGYRRGRVWMGPAAGSRYVRWVDLLPPPAGPAGPFEAALAQLVRRRGYVAVVATSDLTLARLSGITLPVPVFPDVGAPYRALTDKIALAHLAGEAGVAYPATLPVPDDAAASDAARDLGLPAFVKSVSSGEAGPDVAFEARGATRCASREAVVAAARGLREQGLTPIVQAAVPFREKLNAVVLRQEGRSLYTYAHRVLREVPTTGGIGISLETIASETGPGREAVELVERIVDAAGYEGMAQAELYRSSTDGRLHLIDVNPRLWGSTSFAEGLGQRVVERGVRFALGMPPLGPTPYAPGRRFHAVPGELKWLLEQPRRRRALLQLIRTTRPTDAFEFVDVRDPVPLGLTVLQALGRRFGHP